MDIVGQLLGSKYIREEVSFVCSRLCYPEVVALNTNDAEHIAENMVKMFA